MTVLVAFLLALAAAAGCSSHRHPAAPSTPVTGTFHEVGGAPPGINRPLVGTITVYSGTSASGIQVTVVHTDANGRFQVLSPGTFFFVGRSTDVSGIPCTSDGPVTLTRAPASVVVTCSLK